MVDQSNSDIRRGYSRDDWEFELAGHLLGTRWENGIDGEFTIVGVEATPQVVGENEFTKPVLRFEGLRDVWPPDGVTQELSVRDFQRRFDPTLDNDIIQPACDTAKRIAEVYQELPDETSE